MLDKNIVGQVRAALEGAQNSDKSQLVDRLNICKIVLGVYELDKNDLDGFKDSSPDDFIDFYKMWLYRTPDGVVKNGSGIILTLCNMLEKLDEYRIGKNITQEYADRVRKEIEDKRKQLESQEAVASEIKRLNSELAVLEKELDELNSKTRELEELKAKRTAYAGLIEAKRDILSDEGASGISAELEILNANLNMREFFDRAVVSGTRYTVEMALRDARAAWERGGGNRIDDWFLNWYRTNRNTAFLYPDIYEIMKSQNLINFWAD